MLNLIVVLLFLSGVSSERQEGVPCLSSIDQEWQWNVTLEDAIHFSDVVVVGRIRKAIEGDFKTYTATVSYIYEYKPDQQFDPSWKYIDVHNFQYDPSSWTRSRYYFNAVFFLIRQQNTDLAVHCMSMLSKVRNLYNGSLMALLEHIREVGQSDNARNEQKVLPYPNPCDDVNLSGCSEQGSVCSVINTLPGNTIRCTCATGFKGDGQTCIALDEAAKLTYCNECGVYSRCANVDSSGAETSSNKQTRRQRAAVIDRPINRPSTTTQQPTNGPTKDTHRPTRPTVGQTNSTTNAPTIESTHKATNNLTESGSEPTNHPVNTTSEPTKKAPICSCSHFKCPEQLSSYSQVCGTDGNTYKSICHMRRTACKQQQHIFMLYRGTCEEKMVKPCAGLDHPLYTTAGVVRCSSTACPPRHFCHMTTNYSICCPVSATFTSAPVTTLSPDIMDPPTDVGSGSGSGSGSGPYSGYSDIEDDEGSGYINDNERNS